MDVRAFFVLFGLFANTSVEAVLHAPPAEHRILAMPLQTMSFDEIVAAKAAGTGCTWVGGRDLTVRLAMKEDRGAVKRRGRVVRLRPAPQASEAFPYTYHRWQGGGMDIQIKNNGKVVGRGEEHVETIASLTLREGARSRSWQGRLSCGS